MSTADLLPRVSAGASVLAIENGYRLSIPESNANEYRLAQLDNYARLARRNFPHRSLTLSLRARASAASIPGTWGFGLWNDPFGASLGFGGSPFRLPALPNAAWFFYASPQNHISFRNDKPAQGLLAQAFRSPAFQPLLLPAGLALPFSRQAARRLMSRIIDEDSAAVSLDMTQWHRYRLEWGRRRSAFIVDGVLVFESAVSPRPPLGMVIWIDNQFAAFPPDGKIAAGTLRGPAAWIEIEDLEAGDYIGGQ